MFKTLMRLFQRTPEDTEQMDLEAEILTTELTTLENSLTENPDDEQTVKALVIRYNQALRVYAKSRKYRGHIDALFVRLDELRNISRRSV